MSEVSIWLQLGKCWGTEENGSNRVSSRRIVGCDCRHAPLWSIDCSARKGNLLGWSGNIQRRERHVGYNS